MRASCLAVAVAAALAVGAAPAGAQNTPEGLVNMLLDELEDELGSEGWRVVQGGRSLGYLHEGRNESLSISLQSGVDYMFWGACDGDCSDLDFYLYDPRETEVGRDELVDDFPAVTYRAAETGPHRLRVHMFDCSREPCVYGVVALRR